MRQEEINTIAEELEQYAVKNHYIKQETNKPKFEHAEDKQ